MISNVCIIIISLHFLAWIHQFLFLAWNGLKCDWLFKKNEPGTIKTSNQSKVDNIEKKITELWLWAAKASALNEMRKQQISTKCSTCSLWIRNCVLWYNNLWKVSNVSFILFNQAYNSPIMLFSWFVNQQ